MHGVKRFPDKKGERYLSLQELVRLGQALQEGLETGLNPQAIATLKLLVFTGMRKREIETLRWSEVDFDRGYLHLEDSKTGQKSVPLNAPASQVISEIPRIERSAYVFPAFRGDGFYEGTPKVWKKIRKMAEIEDVRLHDLRHSFASAAVSGGASLPLIGSLLGHKDSATTQRYAHLHDDPLKAASEEIGAKIAASMGVKPHDIEATSIVEEVAQAVSGTDVASPS